MNSHDQFGHLALAVRVRGGEPAQRRREHGDDDEAEPEVGHRREEGRDRHDRLGAAAAAPADVGADRGAEEEADDGGDADQAERPRQRVGDDRRDRREALRQRDAEVALEEQRPVVEVLLPDRLRVVEPEQDPQRFDRIGTHLALVAGEVGRDRVALHHPGQEEVDRDRRPGGEDVERGAAQGESHERAPSPKSTSGFGEASRSWRVYGCCGLRITSSAASALDDDAAVEHHDLVAEVAGGREVVGDVEHAEVRLALQFGEQVEHPEADRHVEHRDRLVGDQQRRPRRERPGDRDALTLSAGELVRTPLDEVGREPHAVEQAVHLVVDLRLRHDVVQAQRPLEVVPDGVVRIEGRERVLEHHPHLLPVRAQRPAAARDRLAVEQDAAARRGLELGQDLRDRRLAAAALADEGDRLPGAEREADVVEREQLARPAHAVLLRDVA